MDLSNEEIAEEIAHLREMLRILRRHRRHREQQAAKHGIDVPPLIAEEIRTFDEQIRQREHELSELESLAAVDKYPLVDAKYRKLLAEELHASDGYLGFAVSSSIELARLELGLVREKAKEIEADIRAALVNETVFYVDKRFLDKLRAIEVAVIEKDLSESTQSHINIEIKSIDTIKQCET
jgi:hypothetical protein